MPAYKGTQWNPRLIGNVIIGFLVQISVYLMTSVISDFKCFWHKMWTWCARDLRQLQFPLDIEAKALAS